MSETLESLWASAPPSTERFHPDLLVSLPAAARRYLEHTFTLGAPLSTAARLTMHGTIRVNGEWSPFEAEQVLVWERGFIWQARTRMRGLPIRGADRLVDGKGEMRWKILGLFPVVSADGPTIARAAAGRLHVEVMWLPAVLLGAGVSWVDHPDGFQVDLDAHGERSRVVIGLDAAGAVTSATLDRWWHPPDGSEDHYERFGGYATEEKVLDGVRLPTQYRIGWFIGTDQFETDGEFFRCTLDTLEYR